MTHRVAGEKRAAPGEAIDRAGSGEVVVFVEAPFFDELAQVG
jgi:hypothetical protein